MTKEAEKNAELEAWKTEFPTLLDYIRWLRRHIRLIAAGLAVGAATGLAVTALTVPTYRSEVIFQTAPSTEGSMEDPESIDRALIQLMADPTLAQDLATQYFKELESRPASSAGGATGAELAKVFWQDLRNDMGTAERTPTEHLTNLLRVAGFGGPAEGEAKSKFQFFVKRHDRSRYILSIRGSLREGIQIVVDSTIVALNRVVVSFNERTRSSRVENKKLLLDAANARFGAAQQEILAVEPEYRRNFLQLMSEFLRIQEDVSMLETQLKVKPPKVRNAEPYQLVISQNSQGSIGTSPFPVLEKRIEDLEIEYLGRRIASVQRQPSAPRDKLDAILARFSKTIGERVRLDATLAPVVEKFSASGATVSQLIYDEAMPVDPRTYAIPQFARESAYMLLGEPYSRQQSRTSVIFVCVAIGLAAAIGAAWFAEQKSSW